MQLLAGGEPKPTRAARWRVTSYGDTALHTEKFDGYRAVGDALIVGAATRYSYYSCYCLVPAEDDSINLESITPSKSNSQCRQSLSPSCISALFFNLFVRISVFSATFSCYPAPIPLQKQDKRKEERNKKKNSPRCSVPRCVLYLLLAWCYATARDPADPQLLGSRCSCAHF